MKKDLIPVYEFAKRKSISHTLAYTMIHGSRPNKKGVITKPASISAEKIGNTYFIDWNKYGSVDVVSDPRGRRKED